MPHGDFVWCDLSTFNVDATRAFYERLFGWTYQTMTQPDGAPYHIAYAGQAECAAIFEMPETFQKIGLPSFWMSYIQVDDIERTVAQAREWGGTVEVGPLPFGDGASIALIRDPLGAGFTVWHGDGLSPRAARAAPGQMAWNALTVSDARAVIPFYEALFGWRIDADADADGCHAVHSADGREISAIQELPDALRGPHQYWAVHFAVADPAEAKRRVVAGGGDILYEEPGRPNAAVLARDPDGAAFYLAPGAL